jgi:hypothetical protein
MIHYQLCCSRGHEFDGWFSDSAAFDKQAKRGMVECPVCADVKVTRAMMAPSVAKRAVPPGPAEAPRADAEGQAARRTPPAPVAGGRMPAHLRATLQHLRAEIEKHCDYVGPSFAEEARKMHRGDSEKRGIYGETTPSEAEALAEEGIEVSRIPWVPRADG